MNIVLNETMWAHEMITSRSLGKKPFETLSRVARYYLDNNYSKSSVRKLLDSFLLQCDPNISLPKWAKTIDAALSFALKHEAINIEYIPVSANELQTIESLSGRQIKRLAFTLLCLSKYWDIANHTDTHWVNSQGSAIMRMANINTSIKRQSIMYRILREQGLIDFSRKVDNTSIRVRFVENDEPVIKVCDLRNIGYQYLKYKGEPFFECQNCGITTKYNNPVHGLCQKYCKECAAEIKIKQSINSVMRLRAINPKSSGIQLDIKKDAS